MDVLEQMHKFNREHDKKGIYKQMQRYQLQNRSDVFCPSEKLFDFEESYFRDMMLAKQVGDIPRLNELSADMWTTWLYGTWRNTLRVFKLDESLQRQSTEIPDDTPSTIFENLPDWCVYVELDEPVEVQYYRDKKESVVGFWASLDYIWRKGKAKEITIFVNTTEKGLDPNSLTKLPVREGLTVKQSIERVWSEHDRIKDKIDVELPIDESARTTASSFMKRILGLLLWVCVEEPDVSDVNGDPMTGEQLRLPAYRQSKKGVFVAPSQVTVLQIGRRLGNQLREFERNITQDGRVSSRKRPHIRKGHWHGVWCGAGQNKRFKTYWQPAVFVNAVV